MAQKVIASPCETHRGPMEIVGHLLREFVVVKEGLES